ncbi:MAG: hypothetical protein MUO62_19790 [Anaerolineales bacterium]|nr:hypothetical protein [Anaerolineales bacterium]
MMKQTRHITIEQCLYVLAFGLALGVRLLNLGKAPLSDFEAGWALQSWKAVQGQPLDIGPNPGYFSLTTLVFYLLGSSNSLARLWPALFGGLIVLAPWSFRRIFGRVPAFLIAFGLALDPGMVALSRLAGGPMISMSAVLLALVLISTRKPVWAGILIGFALISGPWVWTGLLGFLIAYGLGRVAGFLPTFLRPDQGNSFGSEQTSQTQILTILVAGGITILAASTLFFIYPGGLGAWGEAFAQYFQGWISPSGIPFLRPVLAVVAYQPLALIAAGVTTTRGWLRGDATIRWLSVWALAALLLSLVYPGRQVYDAAWALVPLWILAALEFARYLRIPAYPSAAFGQAGVVVVLAVLFWLVGLNIVPGSNVWVILVSVPVLILVTSLLVGLGWSWDASRSGFAWGIGVSLGLYSLAAMFGVSQIQPNSPRELWAPLPGAAQIDLMAETLGELALIQNGRVDWIDIVSTVESPALQWVLRDFSEVDYVSMLGADILPSVIITPKETGTGSENSDLSQTMAYRGQDFLWEAYPDWPGALPLQVWEWITERQAPIDQKSIILWARSDLFPEQAEGESEISTSEPLENSEEVH